MGQISEKKNFEESLKLLNSGKIVETKLAIENLNKNTLNYYFLVWVIHNKESGIDDFGTRHKILNVKTESTDELTIKKLFKAYYAHYNNEQDLAFGFYDEVQREASSTYDTIIACTALNGILKLITGNHNLHHLSPTYLSLYDSLANDNLDKAYVQYFRNYFDDFSSKSLDFSNLKKEIEFENSANSSLFSLDHFQRVGVCFDFYEKMPEKALVYYSRALSVIEKNKGIFIFERRRKGILNNLGCINYDEGNYKVAKNYFKKALNSLSIKNKLLNDSIIVDWLAKTHEKVGEIDSALMYSKIKDTISRNLGQKRFAAKIEEQKRKYNNEKLRADNLEIESKRIKNRNWLIAATLALLLGTGIAILLQKNTSKKRQLAEQEALLKQQRVENLLKEQELVSIDAMIAGQEKERQKVAGELHDDLGSLMATIKLHFDNAKVSKKDPALQNAQKLLEEAYQKIRGMAHSKNSGVMSDQGLLPAIKKMAHTITETDALEVTVEDFGLGERMENSLELSIFRIVQELVANTIKHAEASKVNIQLTQHDDNLNIIVEDNGKGFDRSQLKKNQSGMGLTNIEKRVEHLGGSFTIDSVLGKGTSILIDIPV